MAENKNNNKNTEVEFIIPSISKTIEDNNNTTHHHRKNDIVKYGIENIKRGLKFVWKDLRKQHLIWVKVVFFLQSASLVTLYPYLVNNTLAGLI